ncbi:MAG: hypothetical protein HQ494_06295 [Rhodospirillales bacterium]|nr:hypothetical protein [Rhodospirillales bacterium]
MPNKLRRHFLQAMFCTLLLFGLGACSEQPVSDITAPAAIQAIKSGDDKAWDAVRSKKVRWAGSVVKVLMIHGDEFVKEYFLRFDPGFGAGAIAEVPINPSQAEDFKSGQAITVTGIVLSHEKENQMTIVKLGSGKIETAPKY